MHSVPIGTDWLLSFGVNGKDRIHRFLFRIAIDAENGTGHTIQVVVLEVFPRAKEVAGGHFPHVDILFLQVSQSSPGIGYTLLHRGLDLRRQSSNVDGLSSAYSDLGKSCHQLGFGRVCWTELQDEVQDVEKLKRLPLVLR